jgi:hypothetical protein
MVAQEYSEEGNRLATPHVYGEHGVCALCDCCQDPDCCPQGPCTAELSPAERTERLERHILRPAPRCRHEMLLGYCGVCLGQVVVRA